MLRGRDRPMPGPSYMSDEQKADYLQSLRASHVPRPSGSRPAPPSKYTATRRTEAGSEGNHEGQTTRSSIPMSKSMPSMPRHSMGHVRVSSNSSSRASHDPPTLHRQSSTMTLDTEILPPAEEGAIERKPSIPYLERGTRWMEKQEVKSIRMAMEDMDLETERRIHSAAQDEAAELVYRHQNPDVPGTLPYLNPDVRRDYHAHLRKGSYQRGHSQEAVPIIAQRKVSGGSHEEPNDLSITSNKRQSLEPLRKISPPAGDVVVQKRRVSSGKSYGGLAEAVADDIAQAHRRSSSGSRRILSGEKKRTFMHPNDRIWEDPQEEQTQQPQAADPAKGSTTRPQPAHVRKNPFARVRMQAEKLERSRSEPIVSAPMHHSVEIQRNPPSQSRRPWYMSNEPLPPTPPSPGAQPADEVSPKVTPTKDGREIRSDDIRAATGKKRSDYSPNLPRPTVVSDSPGRPIVSFQHDWKPKEVVLEGVQAASLSKARSDPSKPRQPDGMPSPSTNAAYTEPPVGVPQIQVNEAPRPPIPTICLPDEPSIPTINLPEEDEFAGPSRTPSAPVVPVFNIEPPTVHVDSFDPPQSQGMRPAQRFQAPPNASRPQPTHAATSPLPASRKHYTPAVRQSGVLCAHCALPIAGRILSASGERFHPSCFVCYQCHTNLELVAFYPEPEKSHAERAERIEIRRSGHMVPGEENLTAEQQLQQEIEDGDRMLRFYCHLDFHELFSPRCKSCKTPIEGEVIIACGAEWHAGHFFCAQCGDPFDSSTPFVEKEGYAWCVGCHTNRFSSKCRKCKKPVVGTVVKALGHDWHANCFVCTECNGEFQDGRYFLRGASQDPVCVKCEERRLKA